MFPFAGVCQGLSLISIITCLLRRRTKEGGSFGGHPRAPGRRLRPLHPLFRQEASPPAPALYEWISVVRHRHGHTWHVHGCHSSRGHHDKGAHHVVVLVFQQVTMVHESACEAIEGGGDRDKLTRVDPHGVFPAHLVRIERPMPLKEDRCSRSSRFWIEAALIVEVCAERLELDEMHMEGMGVSRQVDDTPYFCRTIGDEPVDRILKLF